MAIDKNSLRWVKSTWVYRFIAIPRRMVTGARHVFRGVPNYLKWLFTSREESNFTYELNERSTLYLAHFVSNVTAAPLAQSIGYVDELLQDRDLAETLLRTMRASKYRAVSDNRIGYARRIGWYAMVRHFKPKVVVETGVDKGLGAAVICAALKRNAEAGHPGKYYGTDIDITAGWLLQPPYAEFGEILYGDSIASLEKFDQAIDLFINDSDHSIGYEQREYEVVLPKLSGNGVIISDNAMDTTVLAELSARHERPFYFFAEEPKDHWYPGAAIGVSLPPTG